MARELRRFESLAEALAVKGFPPENHELIERFTSRIGIKAYYEHGKGIQARRRGFGPHLEIMPGSTTGFISQDEVIRAAAWGDYWYIEPKSIWAIKHPVDAVVAKPREPRVRATPQGRPVAAEEKSYGVCPECFTQFSASGTCACV
ncbi:MAG: hypothetical protein FWD85_12855 [Microbacteriaceae bacterium]|nr:hypothetical protein [Microbacteriaceae bacterium]MCL2796178.1 hypothetical protein [Microbacteriaceae bacterium]